MTFDWEGKVRDQMADYDRRILGAKGIMGYAQGGMAAGIPGQGGAIPGPVNPATGDDTMTPTKRGEYIVPVDAVLAIGKRVLDQQVMGLKAEMGNTAPVRNVGLAPDRRGFDEGGMYLDEEDPTKVGLPGAIQTTDIPSADPQPVAPMQDAAPTQDPAPAGLPVGKIPLTSNIRGELMGRTGNDSALMKGINQMVPDTTFDQRLAARESGPSRAVLMNAPSAAENLDIASYKQKGAEINAAADKSRDITSRVADIAEANRVESLKKLGIPSYHTIRSADGSQMNFYTPYADGTMPESHVPGQMMPGTETTDQHGRHHRTPPMYGPGIDIAEGTPYQSFKERVAMGGGALTIPDRSTVYLDGKPIAGLPPTPEEAYKTGHIREFDDGRSITYKEYQGSGKWRNRPDLGGGPKDKPPVPKESKTVAQQQKQDWEMFKKSEGDIRGLERVAANGYKGQMFINGVQYDFKGDKQAQDAIAKLSSDSKRNMNAVFPDWSKKYHPDWVGQEQAAPGRGQAEAQANDAIAKIQASGLSAAEKLKRIQTVKSRLSGIR